MAPPLAYAAPVIPNRVTAATSSPDIDENHPLATVFITQTLPSKSHGKKPTSGDLEVSQNNVYYQNN